MRRALSVLVMFCLAIVLVRAEQFEVMAAGEARVNEAGQLVLNGSLLERRGLLHVAPRIVGTDVSGEWLITFEQEIADGQPVQSGTLRGRIIGGMAQLTPEGALHGLRDVRLEITEGSGEHAAVQQGDGTLELQLGTTFTARLTLAF